MRQAKKDPKKITLSPRSRGKFKCNQTMDLVSGGKAKSYRSARLRANNPPRHRNNNGNNKKTGK